MKQTVAVIKVFLPGATTYKVVKGEVTKVINHHVYDGTGVLRESISVVSPKSVVYTTEKDIELLEYRNMQLLDVSMETWKYYSVAQRTKVRGKTRTINLPSFSCLAEHGMKEVDFVKSPSKKVKLVGYDRALELVEPDYLARFILFVEDVASTILGRNATPQDYNLEILSSIND